MITDVKMFVKCIAWTFCWSAFITVILFHYFMMLLVKGFKILFKDFQYRKITC